MGPDDIYFETHVILKVKIKERREPKVLWTFLTSFIQIWSDSLVLPLKSLIKDPDRRQPCAPLPKSLIFTFIQNQSFYCDKQRTILLTTQTKHHTSLATFSLSHLLVCRPAHHSFISGYSTWLQFCRTISCCCCQFNLTEVCNLFTLLFAYITVSEIIQCVSVSV